MTHSPVDQSPASHIRDGVRIVGIHLDDGFDQVATIAIEVHGLRLYGWQVMRDAEGQATLMAPAWMRGASLDDELRARALALALDAIGVIALINLQRQPGGLS